LAQEFLAKDAPHWIVAFGFETATVHPIWIDIYLNT
jgi:hypothetical protein